jgi:hypothetical protein
MRSLRDVAISIVPIAPSTTTAGRIRASTILKKWIRKIVARAKRVRSMLSPSSSSRDARAPTGESSLHRYREYLLARPGLNELFLPKDGSKQCDAFAVARKPVC